MCDYLAAGDTDYGNEIWWNGGDGTGTMNLGSYSGVVPDRDVRVRAGGGGQTQLAQYGIFVSNFSGPGLITNSYASNMADAAYDAGACRQLCDMTLDDDTGVNSGLGYSGTNSGAGWSSRKTYFYLFISICQGREASSNRKVGSLW